MQNVSLHTVQFENLVDIELLGDSSLEDCLSHFSFHLIYRHLLELVNGRSELSLEPTPRAVLASDASYNRP